MAPRSTPLFVVSCALGLTGAALLAAVPPASAAVTPVLVGGGCTRTGPVHLRLHREGHHCLPEPARSSPRQRPSR